MSVTRTTALTCDGKINDNQCQGYLNGDYRIVADARRNARQLGWTSHHGNGKLTDLCDVCSRERSRRSTWHVHQVGDTEVLNTELTLRAALAWLKDYVGHHRTVTSRRLGPGRYEYEARDADDAQPLKISIVRGDQIDDVVQRDDQPNDQPTA